jgi:site-specific recombinase XerD
MTLQTPDKIDNAPGVLTEEQRRRVANALESAQSENTRKNYASQLRQFQSWCRQENYSPLPA